LNVKGSDVCTGKEISFEIWEADIAGNDKVIFFTTPTWTVTWQCDGDMFGLCTSGNPEYYFVAKVGDSSIKSEKLSVTKKTINANGGAQGSQGGGQQAIKELKNYSLEDESVNGKNVKMLLLGDTSTSIYFYNQVVYIPAASGEMLVGTWSQNSGNITISFSAMNTARTNGVDSTIIAHLNFLNSKSYNDLSKGIVQCDEAQISDCVKT
jgi:hypothetical protein